ncbi:hypothetical protein G5C65_18070, partial [Streptomyces sp. SB3404]|nr:hypothetical protein [Streptomyces boncukensis]
MHGSPSASLPAPRAPRRPVRLLAGAALNLNFEMIGSPNFARMVHDGDDSDGTGAGPGPPGSDTIERE